MDMSDDEAVTERFHGVAKDIAADRLNDVFDELWTVGFDSLPFFVGPMPS